MERTKVSKILSDRKQNFRPLSIIESERENKRLNFVTDSIMSHSLFGGVATALILATMLCNKNGWDIRIVTRTTECDLKDYYDFLKYQNIEVPPKVEGYSDSKVNDSEILKLEVSDKDIFYATSWWSAAAILDTHVANRIFYIIQEEETFFYNYGDEHKWCYDMINNDNIDFIVNSKLLYDYFCNHGYTKIKEHGIYFEPAFSKDIYYANDDSFSRDKKYKLFFYGRPNNPRNLFYHGLELLDEAISRGIIDTDIWDIYMAGGDFTEFEFSNGSAPIINGVMSWGEYAEFARTVDLSFSLMYTPHPSYPPFDMSCSGAVVLTNIFENKRDLKYSDNMLTYELDTESMMTGFEEAVKLAKDFKQREKNYKNNKISTSWSKSLADVITFMEERV